MINLLKPLLRVWYVVDLLLSKASYRTIQKFDSVMYTVCAIFLIVFVNIDDGISIDTELYTNIIMFFLIALLVKTWWLSNEPKLENNGRNNFFEIVPDDFHAINRFGGVLATSMTFILLMGITGELMGASLLAVNTWVLWLKSDSIVGPSTKDIEWKIFLEDEVVNFQGKERIAKLRLTNVEKMKVFSAFGFPKKLVFEMEDGQLHEIKYYRRLEKILKHCEKTVPKSKIELISYT